MRLGWRGIPVGSGLVALLMVMGAVAGCGEDGAGGVGRYGGKLVVRTEGSVDTGVKEMPIAAGSGYVECEINEKGDLFGVSYRRETGRGGAVRENWLAVSAFGGEGEYKTGVTAQEIILDDVPGGKGSFWKTAGLMLYEADCVASISKYAAPKITMGDGFGVAEGGSATGTLRCAWAPPDPAQTLKVEFQCLEFGVWKAAE